MVRMIAAPFLAAALLVGANAKDFHADVVVVGAGYSGLAAARQLQRSGLNTIVVEGRDRVGGRTYTGDFFGKNLDYGGSYLCGGSDNPLYPLQQEYGFSPVEPDWTWGQWDFNFQQFPASGSASYNSVAMGPYNQATSQAKRQLGRSLYAAYEEGKNWDNHDKERFNSTVAFNVESSWGSPASMLDSQTLNQYNCGFRWRCNTYYPEGGFGGMANKLVEEEGLDVQLNQDVTRVLDSGDSATVETASGDTFTGSKVIVTASLGVLKEGDIEFVPQLNNAKKIAIDRMGMSTCNKVFMAFEEDNFNASPWAQQNLEYFNVEAAFDNAPFYFYNRQLHPHQGGAPILESWWCDNIDLEYNNGMSLARHIDVLRGIYPALSDPVATDFTDWNANKFSRGAYSFPGVGSPIQDFDTMGEPQGNVHFAGEHTHRGWSSVNGAWLSGLRAANEVLGFKATDAGEYNDDFVGRPPIAAGQACGF